MKLTKQQLRQIISEEISGMSLEESDIEEGLWDYLKAAGKHIGRERDVAPGDAGDIWKDVKAAHAKGKEAHSVAKEKEAEKSASQKAASGEKKFAKHVEKGIAKQDRAIENLAKALDELYKSGVGGSIIRKLGLRDTGSVLRGRWNAIKAGEEVKTPK